MKGFERRVGKVQNVLPFDLYLKGHITDGWYDGDDRLMLLVFQLDDVAHPFSGVLRVQYAGQRHSCQQAHHSLQGLPHETALHPDLRYLVS